MEPKTENGRFRKFWGGDGRKKTGIETLFEETKKRKK
jgi:hypothetical protein